MEFCRNITGLGFEHMKGWVYDKSDGNLPSSPCILFMDYNGWWAPLTSLYYSTSSKVLVSRHPESAIEEITSYYCPQCLDPYPEVDAQLYRNKCPSCFVCPLCESPLAVVALDSNSSCFQCRMCSWRSDGCNIVGGDEDEVAALVLEKERDELVSEAFQALCSSYAGAEPPSRYEKESHRHTRPLRYTWDDMNAKLENANDSSFVDPRNESELYNYMKAANLFNQFLIDEDEETMLKTSSLSSLSSLKHRINRDNHGQSPLVDILPPKRVRLRTKRMVRCRKDVKENKMSILIQPKSFPLEGDSSHSLHKGKWWTKDSSAVHEIPQVMLLGAKNLLWSSLLNGELAFLHLSISNYKVNDIFISLNQSTLSECTSTMLPSSPMTPADEGEENLSDPSEPHPPFAFSCASLLTPTEATPNSLHQVRLSAYEDELLRDEAEDRNLPEYAPEYNPPESLLQWGISIQHNVAKVCIPIQISGTQPPPTGNPQEQKYGEIFFKLSCSDARDDDSEGKSGGGSGDKFVQTSFRVVLPIK
jgi:hypothetical protein